MRFLCPRSGKRKDDHHKVPLRLAHSPPPALDQQSLSSGRSGSVAESQESYVHSPYSLGTQGSGYAAAATAEVCDALARSMPNKETRQRRGYWDIAASSSSTRLHVYLDRPPSCQLGLQQCLSAVMQHTITTENFRRRR